MNRKSFIARLAERWERFMPGAAARAEQQHVRRFLDPELTSVRLDGNRLEEIRLAGPLVERLALILAEYCRANNIVDYVEMTLASKRQPVETFKVTVQNATKGKSPHQLRLEAQAECARLRKAIEDRDIYLVAYVDTKTQPYAAAFSTRAGAEEWAAAVDGKVVATVIDRHASRTSEDSNRPGA